MKARFNTGDIVHVKAKLGPMMSHFRADADAIVVGNYQQQYGGNDVDSWTIIFCDDDNEVSWYKTAQLRFLRRGTAKQVRQARAALKESRENYSAHQSKYR